MVGNTAHVDLLSARRYCFSGDDTSGTTQDTAYVELKSVSLLGGSASASGGGVAVWAGAVLSVSEHTVFANNSARTGGALFVHTEARFEVGSAPARRLSHVKSAAAGYPAHRCQPATAFAVCFAANNALAGAGVFYLSLVPTASALALLQGLAGVVFADNRVAPPTAATAAFPWHDLSSLQSGYGLRVAGPPSHLAWPADGGTHLTPGLSSTTGAVTLRDAFGQAVTWTETAAQVDVSLGDISGASMVSDLVTAVVGLDGSASADVAVFARPNQTITLCASASVLPSSSACSELVMAHCPPGWGLADGPAGPSTKCEVCATGMSSNGTGTCMPCREGTVAVEPGQPQCSPCPAGTVAKHGFTCTTCGLGSYAVEGDTQCHACPPCHSCAADAVACSSGLLQLSDGVWWSEPSGTVLPSTQFYGCKPGRCTLDGNHSYTAGGEVQMLCQVGYSGVLCDECLSSYTRAGSACVVCWPAWASISTLVVVCVLLGLVLVAMRRRETAAEKEMAALRNHAEAHPSIAAQLKKLKSSPGPIAVGRIVVNFSQLLSVTGMLRVQGPALFREFMNVNDVGGGSVVEFYPLACLLGLSFAGKFFLTMALPLAALCWGVGFAVFGRYECCAVQLPPRPCGCS